MTVTTSFKGFIPPFEFVLLNPDARPRFPRIASSPFSSFPNQLIRSLRPLLIPLYNFTFKRPKSDTGVIMHEVNQSHTPFFSIELNGNIPGDLSTLK